MVLHIIAWRFALLFIGDISIQKCVTFFKIMDIYVYSNWSDIIYSAAPRFYWITVQHPGLQSPAHHKSRQDCTLCCVFTAPYTIRTTKMLTARGKAFLAKATYRVSLAIKNLHECLIYIRLLSIQPLLIANKCLYHTRFQEMKGYSLFSRL